MKGAFHTALLLLGSFCLNAQHIGLFDAAEKWPCSRAQMAAQARNFQNSADNRSDIRYCRLHWTVDPAVRYIKGEVMTVCEPSEPVASLDFDFSAELSMDSILYHGQKLGFVRSGDILTVQFPGLLPPFVPDSVTFYYQGVPSSSGFGSFEQKDHKGVPCLWTLSQPYGAKDWWPCKHSLTDKIDSTDIFITCPVAYRAASNGVLMSETTDGNWKTAHWKHRYPVPAYLIAFAVTNYEEFTLYAPVGNETIPVVNYVYPESMEQAKEGILENIEHLQLFTQLFGPYPFHREKYGHAQFGWGGGMEHQTMSFVGSFGFDLLSHELAHQWFGDKLTCGSWEDIWLNEGFATYLTGLCYNFIKPEYWELYKTDRITKATAEPDGSVWVNDTSSVSRVFNSRLSYVKGAMLLHMLRWKMGDNAFFTALRNYANDPNLAYGYVRTPQLKAHLEAASGLNLDEFFADWYYGQGYPTYSVKWSKNQSNEIKITLLQSTSHPSVGFYEMPVPVLLTNGAEDTLLVLDHRFSGQTFSAKLRFAPTALRFDPEQWLVSRNNKVEEVQDNGDPLPATYLEVLPNPARGMFKLRLKTEEKMSAKLGLWASDGRLVFQQNIEIQEGEQEIPVQIEHLKLSSGRYLLRLEAGNGAAERAVILY